MRMFRHNFPFVGHFPVDKYTDLKVTTVEEAEGGGRSVLVHKVVMAAVSKKLEVMIDKRGVDGHLVVRNMRFDILQKVVVFVYTGSVEVEEEVDEKDIIDALDMLLIKFEAENELLPKVSQACHGKSVQELEFNILEDTMNSDENGNIENSRISKLSGVGTPFSEFNMFEEDLNFSNVSTDSSNDNIDENWETSREAVDNSNPEASLAKMTSPVNYKLVAGGSTTSGDSNDIEAVDCLEEDLYRESNEENDVLELEGSSGFKEQVMEVGVSNAIINHNLPEILSPGASGSCRAPILLKKNPASLSRNENRKPRKSVSGSAGKYRDRIGGKLVKKHKVESTSEFTRNEKTPEEWKDLVKCLVKCDYCDLKLSYAWYVRHLKTQHPTVPKRRIKCENCYREVREVILKHHKAVLHSNIKVTNEEEMFAKKEVIGETKVKCAKVKCDRCGNIISYGNLSRHYQRVHPGFKLHPGKCGICGIKIFHQVNLKHHLKFVHGKI